MNIIIRIEKPTDYKQTEALVKEAFKAAEISDGTEHQLVARLRNSSHFISELSLVAEIENQLVGHVLLTTNEIVQGETRVPSLSLAPVSVLPKWQAQGVGTFLIETALDAAQKLEHKSVIVLGHPEYYKRFGFKSAANWKITAPFNVPSDVFMALELVPNSLTAVSGEVKYPKEFL